METTAKNLAALQLWHVAVQMYPQSSSQVDAMAANEVATHINLQLKQDSSHLCYLLGGFEVQDPDSGREQASFCPVSLTEVLQLVRTHEA